MENFSTFGQVHFQLFYFMTYSNNMLQYRISYMIQVVFDVFKHLKKIK